MSNLTLRKLRNTDFHDLYEKLLLGQELTNSQLTKILQISVILLNDTEKNLKTLGHRIVLLYSIRTGDLVPLYDISVNLGHIPVAKLIQRQFESNSFNNNFFREYQSSYHELFNDDGKYLTEEQQMMKKKFKEGLLESSKVVVAPTSYGKTELILSSLSHNRNIVIVVPTKALLAQTKARILNSNEYNSNRKLITHHEMYNPGDSNFVAILTQERTIKLLQKNPDLYFDVAFIDEAHNLLEDESRSRLLATAVLMLHHRNPEISINYLTPFLSDHENLKVAYTEVDLEPVRIDEFVKSEVVYMIDMRQGRASLEIYDPFLDKFIETPDTSFANEIDLINQKSTNKNIIYINKPSDIEKYVNRMMPILNHVNNDGIEKACTSLSDYLHEEYSLVDCLKVGMVFHHGSVPDNIKLYVEYLFSKIDSLKYIVTTSTLLEGVNIPARTLFLLSEKRGLKLLSPPQLKNLIGRVCRFSEVFNLNSGSVDMLTPEIFVVGSEYSDSRTNYRQFLKKTLKADKDYSDEPENILLQETVMDREKSLEKREFENFLENIDPGITGTNRANIAETEFGKLCYENNVFEFDIEDKEQEGQATVDLLTGRSFQITNSEELLETIHDIFINLFETNRKNKNVLRLKELGARNFYKMILNWKVDNTSYKQMIASMLAYWNEREQTGEPFVYVGKWGDRSGEDDRHSNNWIDLRQKTIRQRINLAIVRIKDEQDFFENNLFKFVDILYELNLFEQDFYLKIKFGTADSNRIAMIRNGLSLTLSNLLITKYIAHCTIDLANEVVVINRSILDAMEQNDENQIVIHEARLNVSE